MASSPIYLDCHATTPADPRVVDVMVPYFTRAFGNPSSATHAFGWEATRALRRARAEVASAIGARSPREIVFTSGATESNNLALRGVLEAAAAAGPVHVVTSAMEHASVLETCQLLAPLGVEHTMVSVGEDGLVRPCDVEAALRPNTVLVSVMCVNNEVGTIQPIDEIARITRAHGALFHSDAAQGVGRIAIDVHGAGVDLLSISAHKIYGPKGVGALYVRRTPQPVKLRAQQSGGGQEGGLRSGTQNVPAIVGFGEAIRIAEAERRSSRQRLAALQAALLAGLEDGLGPLQLHGSRHSRVAENLCFTIPGVRGEEVLAALPEIAMSAGSACMSNKAHAGSHVLRAMGVDETSARDALRIGLGRFTTDGEVRSASTRIVHVARRLRQKRGARAEATAAPT